MSKFDSVTRDSVSPEWIKEQRQQGWPDMHPEDYCHLCGSRNMLWCTDRESWLKATSKWASETGREGILCPDCFVQMFVEQTGRDLVWILTPWRGSWDEHVRGSAGVEALKDMIGESNV